MHTTLISTHELIKRLDDPEWAIIDCRFSLAAPELEEKNYIKSHIPSAVYAHLDRDMSGAVIAGKTSRHPLPSAEEAARTFSRFGIGPGVQVVVYDNAGGALAAVRFWWMLRWLGHEAAAVLDGGWGKWVGDGYPVEVGRNEREARRFTPVEQGDMLVSAAQVETMRNDLAYVVCDARTADRFRGENETIDPVAGHIPGAVNLPYPENLTADGVFRPVEELQALYRGVLGNVPAERTAFYCGSGVTSIHNILAMKHAGMGEAKLYAGSWSEWITDPRRPVG